MDQERRILKPTNDISFKKIFENKPILKEFINNSLNRDVVDVIVDVVIDSTSSADRAETKVCVTDVYCKSEKGEEFIVEMQLSSQPAFEKRVVFYSSRTFTNQISKGVPFKALQCLYLIVVCDFIVLPNCRWYSHHRMLNETKLEEMEGEVFTMATMIQCDFPIYTYVVLQLPKFDEDFSLDMSDDMKLWMIFLKRANYLTNEERRIIVDKKPILGNAIDALDATNFSSEEVHAYEMSEDARRIADDVMNELERLREQVREAREEGRNEERRALKRKLDETINAGENVDAGKVGRWLAYA